MRRKGSGRSQFEILY